jgi:hypothetical protein
LEVKPLNMNNKKSNLKIPKGNMGATLILAALMILVFLVIFTAIVNLGIMFTSRQKLQNILDAASDYGKLKLADAVFSKISPEDLHVLVSNNEPFQAVVNKLSQADREAISKDTTVISEIIKVYKNNLKLNGDLNKFAKDPKTEIIFENCGSFYVLKLKITADMDLPFWIEDIVTAGGQVSKNLEVISESGKC